MVAVAFVLAAGWWRTHPDRLQGVGDEVGLSRAVIGQPLLVGAFPGVNGSVLLRAATARVKVNTADAQVQVLLCDGATGAQAVGAEATTAATRCRRVVPVADHRLTTTRSGASPQLVVQVLPRRAGQVVIDGIDISYSAGWRRGTQPSGVRITVTVPPRA